MKLKLAASAAALATAFAGPAMAQSLSGSPATVDIDVIVDQIAELSVTDDTGVMVVDDSNDNFMGNPAGANPDGDGSIFNNINGTLAELKLSTNFDVSNIQVDFPKVQGGNANGRIRNFTNTTYFGEAIGGGNGHTLGVWPQVGVLDGPGGTITGGGGVMQGNPADGSPIMADNNGSAFDNGDHHLALGVSTNWTRTANGEPLYAEPDTYSIQLTATIVP